MKYFEFFFRLERQLPSGTLLLYSWDNPIGTREITWSCGNIKNEVIKIDRYVSYIFYTFDFRVTRIIKTIFRVF